MGDEELTMRLESDEIEINKNDLDFVTSPESHHGLVDSSDLGPIPSPRRLYLRTHKRKQPLNVGNIYCSDISKDVSSVDTAPVTSRERSMISERVKEKSASFDSCLLDRVERSAASPHSKKQHSFDSADTRGQMRISGADSARFQGEQLLTLKNANSDHLSQETKYKENGSGFSSVPPTESTNNVQVRPRDTVSDRDDEDNDVQIIDHGTSPGSDMPSAITASASTYQQQRQPKLLKQDAFSMSQEWSLKSHGKNSTPFEKTRIDRCDYESPITPQYLRNIKRSASSLDTDYNLFPHQRRLDTSDNLRLGGAGGRSFDKCYFVGMTSNPHDAFIPKTSDHGASVVGQSPNVKRRKSSPLRLGFEVPIPFPSWGSIGGVYKQKFQSLDDNFERQGRLQREVGLHVAYRRAFSEHVAPFGYFRGSSAFKGCSQDDGMLEESLASDDGLIMGFNGHNIHNDGNDVTNGSASNSGMENGHTAVVWGDLPPGHGLIDDTVNRRKDHGNRIINIWQIPGKS